MQLLELDLNLLVPLQALLSEASVQRAAKRIARTAPATSHALARLREIFDDPLLVRAGQRMVRTPKGDALLPRVNEALARVEATFASVEEENPAAGEHFFRVLSTDLLEFLVLRPLGVQLAWQAPGVSFLSRIGALDPVEALRQSTVDLAMAVGDDWPADIQHTTLLRDSFVTVMRAEHPLAHSRLTLRRYLDASHVLAAPRGTPGGVVDQRLRRDGRQRRVSRVVGGFIAGLYLVASSDHMMTVSRRLAEALAPTLGLVIKAPPVALDGFSVRLLWHKRDELSSAHRWFRQQILGAAADTSGPIRA